MSGYGGPDDEAEHARILAENGIAAASSLINGPAFEDCQDCGEPIQKKRLDFMRSKGMRCMYCILCQPKYDAKPRVRMLDNIL